MNQTCWDLKKKKSEVIYGTHRHNITDEKQFGGELRIMTGQNGWKN